MPSSAKPVSSPLRVLIVDDSPLIRTIFTSMLSDQADIKVVGYAENGQEAVRAVGRLHPHVVTMDIRMPVMDGLEATRQIMRLRPTPIVVFANSIYASDYNIAFNALEAGALTVIEKPHGLLSQDYAAVRDEFINAVRTMAGVTVVARNESWALAGKVGPMTATLHAMWESPVRVVAIGASTGGPPVLKYVLEHLPKDFSIPIVLVQHILPSFARGFAEWLESNSPLPVALAQEGERLSPGKVYVAPGHAHLIVTPPGVLRLEASAPLQGQRPSITRLFQSVAQSFGKNSVGILLTGMGEDGVEGLQALSQKGAHIIAQDQASSTIFGMPKAAIELGIVDEVLAPQGIVSRLTKLHGHNLRQIKNGAV